MADTRFNGTARAMKRRIAHPIEGIVPVPTPAMRTRMNMLAWLARVADELHTVSDALRAGQFEGSLSDEEADSIECGLNSAWDSLANCHQPLLPPELASIKEFREE
jgi:hypothetical protein